MPCGEPHPRYPYPTTEEADALVGKKGGDNGKALKRRQLEGMKEQLPRLDKMIQQATTAKDMRRFEAWRRQLIQTLKKEGIKVPTETKTKDCLAKGEAHRWVIKGAGGTCKKCGATRTFERKGFEVTDEHRQKVIEYVKQRKGQPREAWSIFAKVIGCSGSQLGVIVSTMLRDGWLEEPGGKGSMIYHAVPPAKRKQKAKEFAESDRGQAEGGPKALVPAEKLEAKREARKAKAQKAA